MTNSQSVVIKGVRRAEQGGDELFAWLAQAAGAGKLVVFNARGEFACNSSSSHSIIILPQGAVLEEAWDGTGDFGWQAFTLTDSPAKLRYLAAMLTQRAATGAIGVGIQEAMGWSGQGDIVDHQSVNTFPVTRSGETDVAFLAEFAALMCDDAVVVLGGNDNDGTHPLSGALGETTWPSMDGLWRCRRDEDGVGNSWWVLFNEEDGTKLRLSLDVAALQSGWAPAKAASPELVDIKVTDACPYEKDCGFCYMGSTTKGKAGDPAAVMAVLAALSELGVFEVALGGGEPTVWSHFEEILEFANTVSVVPNFTSRNYGVLRRHPEWVKLIGSVAFSVNSLGDLTKVSKEIALMDWGIRAKVSIQTIPEIISSALLAKIFDLAANNNVRVTLLGYKETGRGEAFAGRIARAPDFWIPMAQEHRWLRLAIDTVMAEACEAALLAADVPEWSFSTVEGAFSMYIDAVEGMCGPSSYVEAEQMVSVDMGAGVDALAAAINAEFATW
jgi:hypothetical protein